MIRWVFLDVGNVLLDEDPLTYLAFRRHVEAVRRLRPEWTFLDLLAAREARATAGSPWPVYEVVSPILGEAGCAAVWEEAAREVRARFAALSPPIPGAFETIQRLAGRYRLGLIANQGPECRARFEELAWLDHFEVVAFSEERGMTKPDPGLFLDALRESGARPEECLMVGDRPDNDLAPAARLGLATAWVRWPRRAAKGWNPEDPEALAYRDSLERSSARASEALAHIRGCPGQSLRAPGEWPRPSRPGHEDFAPGTQTNPPRSACEKSIAGLPGLVVDETRHLDTALRRSFD